MSPDRTRDAQPRPYRVLVTCGAFEPGFRGGGPVRSLARIVDTVSGDVELTLVTRDRDVGACDPYPGLSGRWVGRGRCRVFYLDTGRPTQWLRLWRELRAVPFDLLYVNSLWQFTFTVVPVLAARLRVIRVAGVLLAPRGALSAGALALKTRKKRLFLTWWAPFLKSMDVTWHASTPREASEIRAVCAWAKVEVSQNQVALPTEPLPVTAVPRGPVRLVFIGRVSPKKNLDLTLDALRDVSRSVEFDIYGPLEDAAYWSRCQALIRRLPPRVRVRYRGELTPATVRATFADYDAFVFPTRGENFGHVIAESLSASCPVVCSDQTPWTPVLEAGGGTVVRAPTAEALSQELERIVCWTPAERLQARRLAGTAYRSWRRGVDDSNILDRVRLARQPKPARTG
jgi:glycosyltransferase involved in cell wall biosynthesis